MNIETIAGQLAQVGYVVLDQPLLRSQSAQLYSRCQDDERQRFQPARIGRGAERQQLDAVRGDVICWLDDGDGIDHAYLVWMEKLRSGLNEALYLLRGRRLCAPFGRIERTPKSRSVDGVLSQRRLAT